MNIVKVPIAKVVPWEKNPRTATEEDIDRLKAQIEKLGIYKPLLVFKDGGKYVVLGGNMRLRAYRELGIREVEVSIVKVKTEADVVAITLSDNDRAGYYDEEALAELLYEHKDAIAKGLFKIDSGGDDSLTRLLETLGKEISPTVAYSMRNGPDAPVICPNCGAVVEEGHGTADG